jgi:predicted nuclease with TOPRIM domain
MINKEPSVVFRGRSMRTKNVVYFLSLLLLLSGLVYNSRASPTNSVSFHGVGVTIDLTFPEEAHPTESIWHNVTITANTALTIQNFTIVVEAPVNSTWQEITREEKRNRDMAENESLQIPMKFTPQNANGTLYCLLYVQTNQSADYSSFTFYTTQVRTLTYTELLSAHNQLIANYSALSTAYDQLNANYSALLIAHNELAANYSALFADYGTLLGNYSTLLVQYSALNTAYNGLTSDHATLNATYNLLSANYNALNSTFNSLLAKNNALQSDYNSLNSTYYSLQANYSSLEGNYNSLLGKNTNLQSGYNTLDSEHKNLQTIYNSLLNTKNALQSNYTALNSTHSSVEANYALLSATYDSLNRTYTALETEVNSLTQTIIKSENALNNDRIVMFIFVAAVAGLVAFVTYLKHKKPEPYVVIRKETVTMKQDEKQ